MTDRRYHVKFRDDDSGEELGLILTEAPQLGLQRRLVNPYAAKTGQGETQYSDLTEWTVMAQDDWRGGRGQDQFKEPTAFCDAEGLETRVESQVTLGPYPRAPQSAIPQQEGALQGFAWFGHGGMEAQPDGLGGAMFGGYATKRAQLVNEQWHSLLASQDALRLKEIDLYLRKEAGMPDGSIITLSVYSVGADGYPDSLIGSKPHTAASISTDWGWITFAFTVPLTMDDYESWWIVLSCNDESHYVYWGMGEDADSYPRGRPAWDGGGAWEDLPVPADFMFKAHWSPVRLAQQFTTGTPGFSLTDVSLWGHAWHKPLRVALYSDSGDDPDTKLRECVVGHFNQKVIGTDSTTTTINLATDYTTADMVASMWVEINGETRMIDSITDADTFVLKTALSAAPVEGDLAHAGYTHASHWDGWKKVRFHSAYTLSATTKYWIVAEQLEEGPSLFNGWCAIGYNGAYDGGVPKRKLGDGAWVAQTHGDFLFRLNDFGLQATVTGFARYDDGLFCAAGDTVYKWNEALQSWESSDQSVGHEVTDLLVWGGKLWAARGSEAYLRSYNGSDWQAEGNVYRTLLINFMGGLYGTGSTTTAHKVYYTDNGTDWTEFTAVGAGDYPITALAVYRDQLFAATATRLWNTSLDFGAYPVLDWSAQEDEHNGLGMVAWNKTNCLYIPLRYGVYRWNGDSMVAVGPEQGMGLPEDRAGHIVDLCPTNNWLFAAVDAGPDNVSTVMCYNGLGGWHEIARNEDARKQIGAVFYSTLQEPDRLWYGLGDETRYCELPDRSDNPYQWQDYAFNPGGTLITSWVGQDLLEVVKDLHEVVLRGEGLDADHYIDIYVQVDRNTDASGEPLWAYWGHAAVSPRVALPWDQAPAWRMKRIGADSTQTAILLDTDYDSAGMAPGDFVEINGEISQVQAVTDSAFTLASALAEAPETGDAAYAARPAGREFRLCLAFHAHELGSYALNTPKLEAILVRYQNNVLDRFLWTVKVNCGGPSKDLGGAMYPMTAAALRGELDRWARRETPFTLIDMDGRSHTVKVTSAGEGGYTREEKAGGGQHYSSTYNFNLVEVA